VTEVGRHIIQLLSARGGERRCVSECHLPSLPYIQPRKLVMQLNVCSGAFPRLYAEVGNWGELGVQQGIGTLYKVTPFPGGIPVYFAIIGREVVRLMRRIR
jgi:hypothetical protein